WVSCAEESYAATVRKDDFCRLQAELANTSAALLVEQRRHAETLVRAFGLPSRNEVDALYAQLKDLRRQLAELAEAARSRGADAPSRAAGRPVLICFALVNRPYVLDLQPDRSLVRRLLEAGLSVYLIDWGDPDDADRCVDLEDYIERHLGGSVCHLLDNHGAE